MRESAKVISVKGGRAVVEIDKSDKCSKCGMCLFPKNASSVKMDAKNPIGAVEGDTVVVETIGGTQVLAILLCFVVPLLLIGVAFLLNYLVINSDLITVGVSVLLVVLWYTILAVIDKRYKKIKGATVTVVEILKNVKENTNGRDNQRDE